MPNYHGGIDLDTLAETATVPVGPEDAGKTPRLNENGLLDPEYLQPGNDNKKSPLQDETAVATYARAVSYDLGADAWDAIIPPIDPDGGGQSACLAQTAMFCKRITHMQGMAGSAVPATIGPVTAQGTATARTFALTNALTEMQRVGYNSSAAISSICGISIPGNYRRGTTQSRGGFFYHARLGVASGAAGMRLFYGFANNTIQNTDPSALSAVCGFGQNAADATLRFMVKPSNGTVLVTDLGFNAKTVNQTMEVFISCRPGSSRVHYGYRRLDNTTYPKPLYTVGSVNTNLPLGTDLMSAYASLATAATTTQAGLDISHVYTEQEY